MALQRFIVTTLLPLVVMGCNPYGGKPERLAKPRPQKRTDGSTVATQEQWDDECRANFYKEPTEKRSPSSARRHHSRAQRDLTTAERNEGPERVVAATDAINRLRKALRSDPYSVDATFALAIGYAYVGKRGCSLALLRRLNELQSHKDPEIATIARRTVKRAMGEASFQPFRKEADGALRN